MEFAAFFVVVGVALGALAVVNVSPGITSPRLWSLVVLLVTAAVFWFAFASGLWAGVALVLAVLVAAGRSKSK